MVPVVSTARELNLIVPRIEAAVKEELAKAGVEVRPLTCLLFFFLFLLSSPTVNTVSLLVCWFACFVFCNISSSPQSQYSALDYYSFFFGAGRSFRFYFCCRGSRRTQSRWLSRSVPWWSFHVRARPPTQSRRPRASSLWASEPTWVTVGCVLTLVFPHYYQDRLVVNSCVVEYNIICIPDMYVRICFCNSPVCAGWCGSSDSCKTQNIASKVGLEFVWAGLLHLTNWWICLAYNCVRLWAMVKQRDVYLQFGWRLLPRFLFPSYIILLRLIVANRSKPNLTDPTLSSSRPPFLLLGLDTDAALSWIG